MLTWPWVPSRPKCWELEAGHQLASMWVSPGNACRPPAALCRTTAPVSGQFKARCNAYPDKGELQNKDNFWEGVCTSTSQAPAHLCPASSVPAFTISCCTGYSLTWVLHGAGPPSSGLSSCKPPPTPPATPLRLSAGFCTNLHGPRGYFRQDL